MSRFFGFRQLAWVQGCFLFLYEPQEDETCQHDKNADKLRGGKAADCAAVVAAEKLNNKAPDSIKNEITARGGTKPLLPAEDCAKSECENKAERAFKQLRRQQGNTRGRGRANACRIANSKRTVARRAIAAAGKKTADPAKGLTDNDGWSKQIHILENGLLFAQAENRNSEDTAEYRSVEHKASSQRSDQKGGVRDYLIQFDDPVQELAAEHAAKDGPDGGGEKIVFGDGNVAAQKVHKNKS